MNMKNNITRHSEFISESVKNKALHSDGFRNKLFATLIPCGTASRHRLRLGMTGCNERGRSMVEMLGVIAIIGVISIAGLQGYTAAMKRLRANELLNEASKLATLAAMQIAAGRNPSDEPDSNFVPEFDNSAFKIGRNNKTNKFDIQISDIPQDVCEQMQNMVENSIMQMNGECDGTSSITLTFNDDLSKIENSGNNGGNNDEEENPGEIKCPGNSSETEIINGTPFTVTTGNESITCWCPAGESLQEEAGVDVCKPVPITTCSWNSTECGKGYYCEISDFTTNGECDDAVITNYYTVGKGVCQPIPEKTNITVNGTRLYRYAQAMNWWSAASLCNTNHSRLMVPLDLGIEHGNSSGGTDYCIRNNCIITCPCGNHLDGCTDNDGCDSSGSCDCWEYLDDQLGADFYWTQTSYKNNDANSCKAFVVDTNGYVTGGRSREEIKSLILCR